MFDYLKVEDEIKQKVKEAVEHIGYKFCYILKYSNHPEDQYLYIVVGQGGYKNGYAVWLYNSSLNSLNTGTYDMDLKDTLGEISERIRRVEI